MHRAHPGFVGEAEQDLGHEQSNLFSRKIRWSDQAGIATDYLQWFMSRWIYAIHRAGRKESAGVNRDAYM